MNQPVAQARIGAKISSWYVFGATFPITFFVAFVYKGMAGPDSLGFKFIFGVVPVFVFTFLVVWSLLTYIHLFLLESMGMRGFLRVRTWLAIPLFCVGIWGDRVFFIDLYNNSSEAQAKRNQILTQTEDQLARNIRLFQEPLDSEQAMAVVRFIQDRPVDPQAATEAARQYPHSAIILYSLTQLKNAPPECLRAVYQASFNWEADKVEGYGRITYAALGDHPNTPRDVIEDMVNSHDGRLARFAFRRLPRQEKIEFLKRISTSQNAWERSLAVKDPDTPPYILRRLASDQSTMVDFGLFENPNTPDDVFEGYTHMERPNGFQGTTDNFHALAAAELARRRRLRTPAK